MNNIIKKYQQFSAENHAVGSGTATSYVTAMNKITKALHSNRTDLLSSNQTVWDIHDIDKLAELYLFIKKEQQKEDGGIFKNETAKSYWKQGFCSAAIKDFSKFISLSKREDEMLNKFDTATNALTLTNQLNSIDLDINQLFLEDKDTINSKEGKDILRAVKTRQNQNVFRKIILLNYNSKCCLTNLPIPEVLRASHISPWASDKINRLNPENGICLSATYDAAFDKHLISFDDDYKLILAPTLKEYYTNESFNHYFKKFEGIKITMPQKFYPSQKLLEEHRTKML